jgi:glutamyl-tRNA synthetase
LALLGWSPGDDKENITMEELVKLFTVERVNSSPARFDMKKLEAINGDKIRSLDSDDFFRRAMPFLLDFKVITGTIDEQKIVKLALPIIQERIVKLSEIPQMLKFLFTKNFSISVEELPKIKDEVSQKILKLANEKLHPLSDWNHIKIEEVLRHALIDELGLKPRVAFSAVRVAITGSHISPPLFESLELLGKEASLARLRAAISD